MRIILRLVSIIIGIMFVCIPWSMSQTQSGTIVLFLYSTDKIIIAADSRVKTSEEVEGRIVTKEFKDDQCKIMAFNGNIICAMQGKIRVPGPDGFDCQKQVTDLFFKLKATKHGESLISDLSFQFAESIGSKIRSWYLADPSRAELHIRNSADMESDGQIGIFCAIFAGIGDDGHPCIYGVRIRYSPIFRDIVVKPDGRLSPSDQINGMGKMDIVNEILYGNSERAKAERVQWERDGGMLRLAGKDPDELKVVRLVDLTIAYLEDGKSSDVGGQIDAVRISPDKQPIKWIQRKPNCGTD